MNSSTLTALRASAREANRLMNPALSTAMARRLASSASSNAASSTIEDQQHNDHAPHHPSHHDKDHDPHKDDDAQTHFGFSRVPLSKKQGLVGRVFASVAPSYDLMNDAMSLGVHRLWKSAFVSDMAPTRSMRILDCAGGTADIALRIAAATGGAAPVVVADVNPDMLDVGRARAREAGVRESSVRFVEANAENLPFADGEFDVYAISFGMRNVPRVDVALSEAFRVLKKGGRFMMLEFAKVDNVPAAALYDAYSFNVIPAIGRFVAGDEEAYRYLVESIRQFPSQEEFLGMVNEAGFMNATVTDYSLGIAATYSAFKPVS